MATTVKELKEMLAKVSAELAEMDDNATMCICIEDQMVPGMLLSFDLAVSEIAVEGENEVCIDMSWTTGD